MRSVNKTCHDINILSAIPKSRLFEYFKHYRDSANENLTNIDFILWGEALLDEISQRKLSLEFENALNSKPSLRLVPLN